MKEQLFDQAKRVWLPSLLASHTMRKTLSISRDWEARRKYSLGKSLLFIMFLFTSWLSVLYVWCGERRSLARLLEFAGIDRNWKSLLLQLQKQMSKSCVIIEIDCFWAAPVICEGDYVEIVIFWKTARKMSKFDERIRLK